MKLSMQFVECGKLVDFLDIILNSPSPQETQWLIEKEATSLSAFSDDQVDELLLKIAESITEAELQEGVYGSIQVLIHKLAANSTKEAWSNVRLNATETLYRRSPKESDLRNQLLQWMGGSGDSNGLKQWAELVCSEPPEHRLGLVLAFAPLMQNDFSPPDWLAGKLLADGTVHMQIAPLIFDVFNFWFRSRKFDQHPAQPRLEQLTTLFGQLIGQLGRIEEGNIRKDVDLLTLNMQVTDGVSLVVSLCDFFGLIEAESTKPKLHQAMSLKHRRIQTEASAALTKMGDDGGKELLIGLAEEPVARLRVLKYAEELGFLDQISLEWQGEIATAESHLAIWLSDPQQVGFAPAQIRLIDNREMNWPSYEHPVQCYLFDYRYGLQEDAPGNIGICGPMTYAFPADLRSLGHDDMYAAFAGWQTVHEEIFVTTIDRAREAAPDQIHKLEQQISASNGGEAEVTEIELAGNFFGQWVLLARGKSDGEPATLAVDEESSSWIKCGNANAPIDAQTAWCIVQGRKLLTHFN